MLGVKRVQWLTAATTWQGRRQRLGCSRWNIHFGDPTWPRILHSYFFWIVFSSASKGGRALTDCSCVKSGGCGLFRNMGDEITWRVCPRYWSVDTRERRGTRYGGHAGCCACHPSVRIPNLGTLTPFFAPTQVNLATLASDWGMPWSTCLFSKEAPVVVPRTRAEIESKLILFAFFQTILHCDRDLYLKFYRWCPSL